MCGIVFEKYQKYKDANLALNDSAITEDVEPTSKKEWIKQLFLNVAPDTNGFAFGLRAIFYILIFIWGLKFIFTPLQTNYTGESFWHLVNLPFHEAGHIIFRLFGEFITALGGTLGQLLMPLICLIVFLIKTRDTFAASFSLWWVGENFMDIAPYINDARSLSLPLLGGNTGQTAPYGFHDWEFILTESGLLRYDHLLANLSYKFGSFLMVLSFLWGGYILYKQYQNIRPQKEK